MNKAYKSIWNSALGAWVAVSELSRCAGKHSGAVVTLAAPILLLSLSGAAYAQVTSTGNVIPSPGPSPWTAPGDLYIGSTLGSTLSIQNGATVTVSGDLYLGLDNGAVGSILVKDSGSSLTVRNWGFAGGGVGGGSGSGTINVSNGGSAIIETLFLAQTSGGTGIVNVDGVNSSLLVYGGYFAVAGTGSTDLNTAVGKSLPDHLDKAITRRE